MKIPLVSQILQDESAANKPSNGGQFYEDTGREWTISFDTTNFVSKLIFLLLGIDTDTYWRGDTIIL